MGEIVRTAAPQLKYKILQSPMAGCTDLAFRRIARRFGCQIAFTEMVKDRPVVEGNERTLEMLRTADWDHPLGMQLVGRDPALLAEAVRRLEALGADVIDLNLGCPVPKVVDTGCGAALLRDPDQVGRILDAMISAAGVPVTIKMRTGFEEGDDDRFLRIARLAGECGVAAITVHGRTRKQMYQGFSNHQAIRAVKEAAAVPVIGNGDIRTGADAIRMIAETGCDGVMVARGALGNPWIYREVEAALAGAPLPSEPSIPERAAVLREHFRLQAEIYGETLACRVIRRVIHWFVKGATGAAALRAKGNAVVTAGQFEAVAEEFAASSPSTADCSPAAGAP